MKQLTAVVCLLIATSLAAQVYRPASQTIATSGNTAVMPNLYGGFNATFEEIPSGAPATVSITVQGCMTAGTCDTAADTNTTTSATIRGVAFTKVYSYFLITASWTGGSSPTVTVNSVISTARSSTGGSGTGTVTSVGLTLPAVFTVSGSPVTTTGSLTAAFASIGAHLYLGNNTGGSATAALVRPVCADLSDSGTGCAATLAAVATSGSASDLAAGTLPAARLPVATTSTFGGVKDLAAVTNNFITSIVGGVPVQARPTCGNLSDSGTGCSATLAAVATSGSATDLGSGTLNNARLPGGISVTTLTATGAVTGSSFVGTAAGGVGNNWLAAEGTDPGTEATGQDLCWSDSAAHAVKCSFNNDTASQMARASNTLAFFAAGAIANGSTAASQTQNSNDTKVATDAYVDRLNSAPLTPCSVMPTTVHVGSSNFTSSASGQTAITGLAFTLPGSTACNYVYQCHLVVNEATSASVLTFSVNDVTTAPTNMIGWGRMSSTVNADSTRVLVGSSATGSQTLIAIAPGASATNLTVMLDGFIEQPSGTASVVQFELGVTGGTNVTTISRGSNCWMHRE